MLNVEPERLFTSDPALSVSGLREVVADVAPELPVLRVRSLEQQVEAGAHMLDVNAGIPLADEPAILADCVKLVQSITDVPLSIDSSIVAALEAGLAVYQGKALVNSVTGEEERLEAVLPLIRKYGAAVVAISNDETGISEDPDVRFEVAKKIVERAADHGIPREDLDHRRQRHRDQQSEEAEQVAADQQQIDLLGHGVGDVGRRGDKTCLYTKAQ